MTTKESTDYAKLSKRAVQAAVAVSFLLLIAKYIAWYFSGSATLLSSLTDSSLDLLASVFSFSVLIYALRPADVDHRFGHARPRDSPRSFNRVLCSRRDSPYSFNRAIA